MNWFRNLPIRNKMVALVLGITTVTLLISGSLWIYLDRTALKHDTIRHWTMLARTVGQNARAAVMFQDSKSAQTILSSMSEDPHIRFSALFDPGGQEIARCIQNQNTAFALPLSRKPGVHTYETHVEILEPIFMDQERVGTIYLNASLKEVHERMQKSVLTLGALWLGTLLVAFLLIWKMQTLITGPLLSLAGTARKLSREPDYSLRVSHESTDEIGTLFHGFNEMLERLQSRDRELEGYRLHLEELVQKRTSDLVESNSHLLHEIRERQHTQKRLQISLEEKEILLKEINHRTKNNMQILSSLMWLQARDIRDPEVAGKLMDCTQRIRAMALVHEKIFDSPDLTSIEFSDYLKSLFHEQLQSFGLSPDQITFRLDAKRLLLTINPGMYLGLIINELISNSLKHAFSDGRKGIVQIIIQHHDERSLELIYRDNGIGLPTDLDLEKSRTLGLRLIHQLVEQQLHGSLDINRRNPLEIQIRFPISGEK